MESYVLGLSLMSLCHPQGVARVTQEFLNQHLTGYSLPDFCLRLYSELTGAGSVCCRCWLIAEAGTAAAKVSGGEN